MKIKSLILAAMASMLLAGCIQGETPAPKVGVVDTARVFRDCAAGKAGVKFLEGLQTSMQTELNAVQGELQKKPDDPALQEKLQELYMSFQQRMNAEQQQVLTLINDSLQRGLDSYRTQKGLSVILDGQAALSYDKAIDITTEIIAELDKQKIEFKPVMDAETPDSVKKEEALQNGSVPATTETNADKPEDKPAGKPANQSGATKGDKAASKGDKAANKGAAKPAEKK